MAAARCPVLAFAHYFGGSARSWVPLIAALGDDFDCIAPSLPGFGATPAMSGTPSLGAYADCFTGMAARQPWIAVAHSMGGKIALAAAMRRPPGLKGMILIASSPPTPEPMSEADRRKAIDSFGNRAAAKAHLNKITDHSLPPSAFDACVEDELSVDSAAWLWWLERGSRDDISAQMVNVDVPVLVLSGDDDTVLGLQVAFGIARQLARVETGVVGGGHLLPLEQPGVVADAIRDFAAVAGSD